MKWLVFLMCVLPSFSLAETWVSVGADTEARYYVDTDSIQMEGENTIVMKKGAYTQTLTDKLDDGKPVVFKATMARLEIDCERGLNRVTQMDMVSEEGDVVWSSGYMDKRIWLTINVQGHARTTFDLVCGQTRQG